ncbi:tetratricopeptide repeat protein [Microbispora sp. NPDC049125]|uniref:ATP-binding protein n=1 Tax=Microbispora sp. NPDC049125 TaxID=3154929 RepID=UPI00346656D6
MRGDGDGGPAHLALRMALRQLRRQRGLSQRELARPLHLGSHSAIADYESGRRLPPADIITAYERHFALQAGQLQRLRDQAVAERAAAEVREALADAGSHQADSGAGERNDAVVRRTAERTTIPRQLPMGTTLFTGRSADIARLDEMLTGRPGPAAAVISAIGGMAGIGKTSLAVHWAHRVRDRFPDGELYVDLRGYHPTGTPLSPDDVLNMFLGALGLPRERIPTGLEQRAALYRTLLTDRTMLVLLDNARTVEQVRPLLPGRGGCVVLVTSRSRLTGLAAREGAHRIVLDLLTADESAELLRRSIGRARVDAEPDAAAALARHCAYHPLALRVAAERANAHDRPLADTAAELADRRARLDVLAPDEDETTAVRAVFGWSYDTLSPDARRLFRLIGLHDGPDIDARAAAALAGTGQREAARLLGQLTGAHLVQQTAPGRYRLHDLLRLYARERATEEDGDGLRTAATRRLAGWYLHSACAARVALSPGLPPMRPEPVELAVPPMSFASHAEALTWCETELANLVAATQAAEAAGLNRIAWQLPTALYGFFDLRKHYGEWVSTHQFALRCARRVGDREAEGRILCNVGNAYLPMHRLDDALAAYQEALAIFREVGYRQGEAKVLGNLGSTYDPLGRWEEAAEAHQRSLQIFQEIGDRYGEALTVTNIGEMYFRQARFAEAAEQHRRAMAISRAIPDPHGDARALSNLCAALAGLGDAEDALRYGSEALELFRSLGDRYEEAMLLTRLGDVHDDLADPASATTCRRQALALFQEIGDDRQEARLRDLLGPGVPLDRS